jgi:hypothetical protein
MSTRPEVASAEGLNRSDALAARQRYLVKVLALALEEVGPIGWDKLVTVAIDYAGSVVPKVTRKDFEAIKHLTVRELFLS